jgi:hypothetical protein
MSKELSILKRPHLSKGQTMLYALTVKKIKEDSCINFEDAKELYIGYG